MFFFLLNVFGFLWKVLNLMVLIQPWKPDFSITGLFYTLIDMSANRTPDFREDARNEVDSQNSVKGRLYFNECHKNL